VLGKHLYVSVRERACEWVCVSVLPSTKIAREVCALKVERAEVRIDAAVNGREKRTLLCARLYVYICVCVYVCCVCVCIACMCVRVCMKRT